MFEEIISTLDQMGVQYTEDYETGSLDIAISDLDKMSLIELINVINNAGMPFTIDETSIVISGAPIEAPMPTEDTMGSAEDAALQDMLANGGM